MSAKSNNRLSSPRRLRAFESEIHPSHKSAICALGISLLQGAKGQRITPVSALIFEKIAAAIFCAAPSAHAAVTAATVPRLQNENALLREKGHYGET